MTPDPAVLKPNGAAKAAQETSVGGALAVAVVRRGDKGVDLASLSAGASVAFSDLCLALSEAPVGPQSRSIDFAGLGRVSFAPHSDDKALIVFVLHEAA